MRPARGFTLIEMAVTLAAVAVLAAIAFPAWQGHQLRAARIDAVAALTRVQVAQEQYRSHHGLYASNLSALQGVAPTSAQGRYTLALDGTGAESYRITAHARGAQERDRECAALTLDVSMGFPTPGPSAACWNR